MTGAIVLATDQGLGILAKSFFDHGLIDKVYIHPHSSRENHYYWYPETARAATAEELLSCSTLLFFEEVFNWKLIAKARQLNVKTVLMPMYECTRNPLPLHPDVLITPSDLDQQYYPAGVRINVPVEVPWRKRTRARVFVHNAGNGGIGGRNGTKEVLEALQYVKSPIKLIVRSQVYFPFPRDKRLDFRLGTIPYDKLWEEGDVFLFPERFNGLSLPLQEAFASGMLVMAGDRFPINTWLPNAPLIPVEKYTKQRIAVEFDCAQYTPQAIASKIDEWYDKDIREFSEQGRSWSELNSWTILKEKYKAVLSR
jgi:glycosyltransferase involved in cell wall biosynthesis